MGRRLLTSVAVVLAVTRKDLIDEFRTRYAFGTIFLFAVAAIVIISFPVGYLVLNENLHAVLFWLVIFFSSQYAPY